LFRPRWCYTHSVAVTVNRQRGSKDILGNHYSRRFIAAWSELLAVTESPAYILLVFSPDIEQQVLGSSISVRESRALFRTRTGIRVRPTASQHRLGNGRILCRRSYSDSPFQCSSSAPDNQRSSRLPTFIDRRGVTWLAPRPGFLMARWALLISPSISKHAARSNRRTNHPTQSELYARRPATDLRLPGLHSRPRSSSSIRTS